MRSSRLAVAILALALVAAACSDDEGGEDDAAGGETVTTTTRQAPATTAEPPLTTPTTAPPEPAPEDEVLIIEPAVTTSTTSLPETVGVAAPPVPSNLECVGGTAENELRVEFDALPNPSDVSKVRTYLQLDGEAVIANGEFTIGELNTSGSRWTAPVRRIPAKTPVKLYVTAFNQLGEESGWYSVDGFYNAAGAACGEGAAEPELPPTTCTAGCDEDQGEPAS